MGECRGTGGFDGMRSSGRDNRGDDGGGHGSKCCSGC